MANTSNELATQYEQSIKEKLHELKTGEQPDATSLGEDQEYELFYLNSHRQRFRQIWDDVPNRTDISILDIGPTPFTFVLNELMTEGSVATLDYTDLMKSRCEGAGIIHITHDLHEGVVPFNDSEFDVIIFHGVLEHLFTPPKPLIEDMKRALNTNGRLLLGTPNFARLENRVKLSIGKNPQEQIEQEHVHGRGHVREYTLNECEELVEKSGFTVQRSEYHHYTPLWNRVKNGVEQTELGGLPFPADYLASTVYYTITAAIPSLQYHNYVVATKN